ncbi:MAG: hypothetical protein ACK58T_20285, partial [Phycisphaerae bacterium]
LSTASSGIRSSDRAERIRRGVLTNRAKPPGQDSLRPRKASRGVLAPCGGVDKSPLGPVPGEDEFADACVALRLGARAWTPRLAAA